MKAKHILAALALSLALPAHAVGRMTDASDLWFNSAESGWGVNVIQQNEIVFLTFFAYSASRNPVWYSASEMRTDGPSNGVTVYQGRMPKKLRETIVATTEEQTSGAKRLMEKLPSTIREAKTAPEIGAL